MTDIYCDRVRRNTFCFHACSSLDN